MFARLNLQEGQRSNEEGMVLGLTLCAAQLLAVRQQLSSTPINMPASSRRTAQ
jgi:hypothetical protein